MRVEDTDSDDDVENGADKNDSLNGQFSIEESIPTHLTEIQMENEQETNNFFENHSIPSVPNLHTLEQRTTDDPSVQPMEQLLAEIMGPTATTTTTTATIECPWCHIYYKERGLKTHERS